MEILKKIIKLSFFMIFIILLSCSSNEEKKKNEKVNLEPIKKNRDGLDYKGKAPKDLFKKLDMLLEDWQKAQEEQDYAYASHLERELYELSRGYFSELVKNLNNEKNKNIAIAALGFSKDIRAIPYLIEVLKKGDEVQRTNAALSLGLIGSDQTPMETLFNKLKKDPSAEVRAMCAFAISQIVTKENDQEALPHLIEALNDSSSDVKNNVIIALTKIGDEKVGKIILKTTLNDKDPIVRYNSIRALGELNIEEAVKPLIKILEKEHVPYVKEAALVTLRRLTGENFGKDVKKWKEWAGIK